MNSDEKLAKLVSILLEYANYLKLYSEVEVTRFTKTTLMCATYGTDELGRTVTTSISDKKIPPTEYIKITYKKPRLDWMCVNGFESIEFPMENIDRRIEHYRNKLKNIKEKNTQTIGN